jgi:hypothetical protein
MEPVGQFTCLLQIDYVSTTTTLKSMSVVMTKLTIKEGAALGLLSSIHVH